MKINITFISLLALLTLCSCTDKDNSAATPPTEKNNNHVKELKNEIPEFVVDSNEIEIGCIGTISVPPKGRIDITAGIDANVFDIQVLPGTKVNKGDLLARIKNRSIIDLQSRYISAKTEAQNLEIDFTRKETLHKDNAISEKEYLQVKSLLESKRADVKGLEAQLAYIGISAQNTLNKGITKSIALRATTSGTVVSVHVNEGAFVSENQSVFTIIDNKHLHLDLEVFAKDVAYLNKGQNVSFSVNGNPTTYTATVKLISAEIEHESNTLMVHAQIDGDATELIAGSVVQAQILAGKRTRHLISEKWITHNSNDSYFEFRGRKISLQLGSHENGFYEVLNYNQIQSKLN